MPYTGCFELKLEKGKSFAFNKVADHQIFYLRQAKEGMYYKISDMAAINGYTGVKPFDCQWIVAEAAMVVICFYVPRKSKTLYFIDVDDYVKLREQCLPKKSITREDLEKHIGGIVRFVIEV